MTTIVWDGKSIAADRGCTAGNVRTEAQKLFQIFDTRNPTDFRSYDQYVVAFCGDASYVQRYLETFHICHVPFTRTFSEPALNPHDWYEKPRLSEQFGLAVRVKDNALFEVSLGLVWEPRVPGVAAIGCGFEVAYGALDAGCDAARTMEIVSRRTGCAFFGYDMIKIEDLRTPKVD